MFKPYSIISSPLFIGKLLQIVIDSCCATFAEVQKRGKDFWSEFELYVADLLVGVVVNVALVGMLAPYVRIGQPSLSKGFLGRLQHAYGSLPSRYQLLQDLSSFCYYYYLFIFINRSFSYLHFSSALEILLIRRSDLVMQCI